MENISMLSLFLFLTLIATGNETMMKRVMAVECIEERQVSICDACNLVCRVAHFLTTATGRCYSEKGDPDIVRCFCFYQCD
ncbi:unnamed protein product [Lactuca virosa]|uniref:Uncharacterized protein n=1 Tax=Lactuca virosa TaxID=75947 RepID=A0AAU9LRK6_9ASTR|nr:unnamed protein product [Lactuca virosa]